MKRILFFIFLFTISLPAFSQQSEIDSLLSLLKTDKEDTGKVKHLNKLSGEYENISSYDSSIAFATTALKLSQQLNPPYKKGITAADNNIGAFYFSQSDYPKALDYYFKALKMDEELGDKKGIADDLDNFGPVYDEQGNFPKALDYDFKALKMDEELGDKEEISDDLGNIGIIYKDQGDYSTALDNLLKALKMNEELGNKKELAENLDNIGIVYYLQGASRKALDYYFKALKLVEELGDKNGIADDLGDIGNVYVEQSDYPKALDYLLKALKMAEELGDKQLQANTLRSIGSLYTVTKKYAESEKYLLDALNMDKEIGAQDGERDDENNLSNLYEKTDRYQLALGHYKKAMVLKDTLFNTENSQKIANIQLSYELEKKDAVQESEDRKTKIVLRLVFGFLILVLIFAGSIFRSLRVTSKQKVIIEEKNKMVEEKQKEILDSITYAKRLQEAILPPIDFVKRHLPDSSILYKPKDIVAGDFYWMEVMENTMFIAAADCTGHGVPGAMVSVVCSNALNRTVKEFGLRDTGTILDKVAELVLETFEKSDKDVKDGMDISLMSINTETKQIQWSGANNALWYIHNNELTEITADKQPIGKYDNRKPFTTHSIAYLPGTTFYLYTDGYPDQFGGAKGKKFKYKQLEEKLLSMSDKSLEEQKNLLDKIFDDWKGNLEQVDDVCIIGIKV